MATAAFTHGASAGARRKMTVMVLAAALLAALLAVLNPLTATKAFALDDGRDVNWFLGHGQAGYKNMIDAVRKRVGKAYVNSMDVTGNGAEYFSVNIYRSDRRRQDGPNVRVILSSRDLYVQGVYDADYNQYFHFADARLRSYRPTSGSSDESFGFNGSYQGMTAAAGGSFTMRSAALGHTNFQGIVDDVASNGTSQSVRARGMVALVEAIAEGARFDYISGRIHNSFMSGNPFRFNTEAEGLAKNWSGITKTVKKKVNAPQNRDVIRIGSLELISVESFKVIVALLLISAL